MQPPHQDPPEEAYRPAAPPDDTNGCLVQLVAVFGLVGALVLLLAWYVGQTGTLPFTWSDGPYGVPAWAPPIVLAITTALAVLTPLILSKRRVAEPTFVQQIAVNRRNSIFLTVAIAGGLGLTAYAIAAMVTLRTSAGLATAAGAVLATVIGAVVSLRAGDRIVLAVSRASEIDQGEQRVLTDVVQEMAVAADLPMPTLYLIDDSAPNAFSIGRDQRHASLAVTIGLLATLDREELQGVVAHEMAHIRNQDTRYSLFVAVLVGTTVLVADGFFKVVTFPFQMMGNLFRSGGGGVRAVNGGGSAGGWSFPSINLGGGGGGGGGGGSGGKGGGSLILIIVAVLIFLLLVYLVALLVHVLSPIFSRVVQASVSREREYLADATAVELGRDPAGLERALLKVARSKDVLEVANRATAPLYFVNPIRAFESRAQDIYSTHPPTIDRVNRLRQLQGEPPIDPNDAVAQTAEDLD
jgi:heat shock protein HtpX